MDTKGSFPGGKAAGAWSWPLTSNWCRGQENVDIYIHSPTRLPDRDNFTFYVMTLLVAQIV
jgi:hypothetical protein